MDTDIYVGRSYVTVKTGTWGSCIYHPRNTQDFQKPPEARREAGNTSSLLASEEPTLLIP